MRTVVTVLLAGSLAGLILWRLPPRSQSRVPATTGAGEAPASSEELAALRREVALLRRQMSWQQENLVARAQAAPEGQSLASGPPPVTPEQRLEAAAASHARASTAVRETFGRERPDPSWSGQAQAELGRDLQAAGLQSATRTVDCAATMCRVVLDLADADLRDNLGERLQEVGSLHSQILYDHEPEATPPRVTLYVSRPGQSLALGR